MVTVVVLAILVRLSLANLTVYCEDQDDKSVVTYGGFREYRSCDGSCDCYVFELLCLERDDLANDSRSRSYKLLSRNYEYARQCS